MDDGMLGRGMTLEGIGRQLTAIQQDLAAMNRDMADVKQEMSGLKQDVSGLKQDLASTRVELRGEIAGVQTELRSTRDELRGQMLNVLDRVDGLAHDMKVQFEETHGLLRFGLEAREAPRETMEDRFAAADRKHDRQIELLEDVLRGVRPQAGRA